MMSSDLYKSPNKIVVGVPIWHHGIAIREET